MIRIYHNPRCKKSRAGLQALENKTTHFETIHYLKDQPFTEEGLTALLQKMKKKPLEMMRKQEKYFKENIKGHELSDNELIKHMVAEPKLINRPIVETNEAAIWADPYENLFEIL